VRIRPATTDDAEALCGIYNPEVLTSTVTFDLVARSVEEQRRWIEQRSGAHSAIVATDDTDRVIGFGALSPYRERPAYSTSVEDSIYVHRDHHGQGLGKLLLSDLVTRATHHGFHAMFARIVGDHEVSIALHASLGFEIIGHEREVGRKFGRWLDVIVMERLLGENAPAHHSRGHTVRSRETDT
jgi:phosphinothricin acetyltransferase